MTDLRDLSHGDVAAMEQRAEEALARAGHDVRPWIQPDRCWRCHRVGDLGAACMGHETAVLARDLRAVLAHSQQQALRIAALEAELKPCAGWQQLAQDRADEVRQLKEPVPYRPGLPSVDQVRAHEARGGWWQSRGQVTWSDGSITNELRVYQLQVSTLAEMFEDWEPEDHMRWSRRPCSPDGTPLPWPVLP